MRTLLSTLMLAAVLGTGSIGGAGAAGPAGLAPGIAAEGTQPIVNVSRKCGPWGCGVGGIAKRELRAMKRFGRAHFVSPGIRIYIEPRVIPRYVAPRAALRLLPGHVSWCHARYKSYRAWDNSWKPNHGPRRRCASPFR